jgi:DASS family divalent anion:Na+ symporter
MPLIIYLLAPPQLKATPNAVEYAQAELAKMGPVSPKERVMMGTFGLLLVLWADVPALLFGPAFKLDPTVVAFVGLFVLIITGTLDWDDVLSEYATGTSPIIFGSGFVTMGLWWRVGFVMCLVELLIFAAVGSVWWKLLGYW